MLKTTTLLDKLDLIAIKINIKGVLNSGNILKSIISKFKKTKMIKSKFFINLAKFKNIDINIKATKFLNSKVNIVFT